jgi:hypothetical protein
MQLADLFSRTIVAKLENLGWKQVPSDEEVGPTLVLHEVPEVEYQLSMLPTVRPDGMLLNPALGVRHPETDRLGAKFLGLRPSAGTGVSLFGASLARLLFVAGIEAPFSRWIIPSAKEVEHVTDVLVDDLETYGMPFFRSIPTLDAAIAHLQQEKRAQPQTGNLAIVCAVAGRRSEALAALAEYAAEARDQQPPLSTQTWRFVRSFIQHFGIDESSLPFPIAS